MKILFRIILFSLLILEVKAQEVSNIQSVIGFYNVENLFDTADDPNTYMDNEFLAPKWTDARYSIKLNNMSKVIASMNPDIIGLAEIENRKVLEDLVLHANLAPSRYQIIHFDRVGIDVALFYKPSVFKPFKTEVIPVVDKNDPKFLTRDILWVKGLCMGDTLNVVVNHWPSRRGGKEDKRILAATTLRKAVDSVLQINPKANIVIMGDLNDDPSNKSVKKILLPDKSNPDNSLINTAEPTFKKGYGTLAYDGLWNLFDQIIISKGLSDDASIDYIPESYMIFAPLWMQETKGKYTGMPKRTFRGPNFNEDGFSDHFPVFIRLIKR